MAYYIDLTKITIDQYKKTLKTADLLPSWMILKEDIDHRLDILIKYGIKNLSDLLTALKNKEKIQEFSAKSSLPEEYLAVLRRVVNGYRPKPNKFKDFQDISNDTLTRLEAVGVKNSLQLYEHVLTDQGRKDFAKKTGIELSDVVKLARYSDISRIRWVNHTFAYVLYEAGYDSAVKVTNENPREMYLKIKKLNEERKIYNAHIGENDMKLVIEIAKGLDNDIEY